MVHRGPDRATVWVANGANPIIDADTDSPELTVPGYGDLGVVNQATKSVTWSAKSAHSTPAGRRNTSTTTVADLLNSGNLVLRGCAPPNTVAELRPLVRHAASQRVARPQQGHRREHPPRLQEELGHPVRIQVLRLARVRHLLGHQRVERQVLQQ